MATKKSKTDKRYDEAQAWLQTPEGVVAYRAAREEAQKKADERGADFGLELNPLFKTFHVFGLPSAPYRCGHELRCEVVHPMRIESTQKGHGWEATRQEVAKVLTPRYVFTDGKGNP